MTGGWQALRASDPDIALALLFAPSAQRELIADRLHLAIESENALRLATEPMLAAIRLQWWVEAIETRRHESVPLMERLIAHIDAAAVRADDLVSQVGLWQDRLASAPEDAGGCWGALLALLVPDQAAAAEQVGHALAQPGAMVGDEALHLLATGQTRWVWMMGVLARHRQNGAGQREDPLLIWRMLGWRFGIRLPSSSTTSR